MEEWKLSKTYQVRKLTLKDVDMIFELCRKNPYFYQFHQPFVTRERIIEDMNALPPKKEKKDKYYIGFFHNDKLIAVMDLILGYPNDSVAYIGFFMMNQEFQKQGIGTSLIKEVKTYLCECGFLSAQLGIDKGNPQSKAFWSKNGFVRIKKELTDDELDYIPMEAKLIKKQYITIKDIPCILWGEKKEKWILAVHGNMSNKEDVPIAKLAEVTCSKGYQVLSFDLPEHGERKGSTDRCHIIKCVEEIRALYEYVREHAKEISVMANSMGAYFTLSALADQPLKEAYFLSPVVNMRRIIESMMQAFGVSESRLQDEKEIKTPIGVVLYDDYYDYVKSHSIHKWDVKTSILYGVLDDMTPVEEIKQFATDFGCELQIEEMAGHYFHTKEEINTYVNWLEENIK